jgi:hypothetical protein
MNVRNQVNFNHSQIFLKHAILCIPGDLLTERILVDLNPPAYSKALLYRSSYISSQFRLSTRITEAVSFNNMLIGFMTVLCNCNFLLVIQHMKYTFSSL